MDDEEQGNRIIEEEFKQKYHERVLAHELAMAKATRKGLDAVDVTGWVMLAVGVSVAISLLGAGIVYGSVEADMQLEIMKCRRFGPPK